MELNQVEVMRSALIRDKELLIIPIGDVQYLKGNEACDFERFKRVIQYGVENNAYYIGMGDYVDGFSPSNRGRLLAALADGSLYDAGQDSLDLLGEMNLAELEKVLEPTKGRWLGLLEGHHFWQFADGTTSDMRLAQFLKAPFLGTSAMVQVKIPVSNTIKGGRVTHNAEFVIWCHHGRAGGKLLSAPVNQLEHVIKAFDADVYLVGHHHKVSAAKTARIVPKFGEKGSNWLEHKDLYLACTGSFLKGYMAGNTKGGKPRGSYVEAGMMNPVALGVVMIRAKARILHGIPKLELSIQT